MAISQATQNFVQVKEIRDGVVILKDNSMRAILMTSSLNFALKSEDEQQGIIFQFQNFLNSLDFSVQIFIQSRRLDIRPYLALLENRQKEQTNDLIRIQTKEYIEFIKTFTENTAIMTKSFFIVVPFTPPKINVNKKGGPISLPNKKIDPKVKNTDDFEEARIQLEQRISVVKQGIVRTGVRAVQLGTEELIEVYYKLFNPGDVEKPITVS